MDAAEIARMRADTLEAKAKCAWHVNVKPDQVLALLDALEQAQKDMAAQMDSHDAWGELWTGKLDAAIAERDQAQQSAKDARALLVEAMLEQKP